MTGPDFPRGASKPALPKPGEIGGLAPSEAGRLLDPWINRRGGPGGGGGAAGGYRILQEEGVAIFERDTIDFVGALVTASDVPASSLSKVAVGIPIGVSDPGSPLAGDAYLNTTLKQFCIWDGTKWWRTGMTPDAVDTYSSTLAALSPSSYWKLDEASGNFADSVGPNPGTPAGVITYGIDTLALGLPSGPAKAIHFPGATSGRIDFGDCYDIVGNAFSWNALVYITAGGIGANSTLMSHGANGGNSWDIRLNTSRKLEVVTTWTGSLLGTSIAALSTGAWHMITVLRNAGPTTWTYDLYIDGAFDSNFTSTSVWTNQARSLYAGVFDIGSFGEPADSNIRICGIGIWDGTEITSGDISSLKTAAGL